MILVDDGEEKKDKEGQLSAGFTICSHMQNSQFESGRSLNLLSPAEEGLERRKTEVSRSG
jgi:hypothetical protein